METFGDRSFLWDSLYGKVDVVDGESIQTAFHEFWLPIAPIASYYIQEERGEFHILPIDLHWRSVAAGYARWLSWAVALVLIAPAIVDPARWGYLAWFAMAASAIGIVSLLVLGRLSVDEEARRRLLRAGTDFGVPPELLPETFRDEVRDRLLVEWSHDSNLPWTGAIKSGQASPLLYALAEYHDEAALAARVRDRLLGSRSTTAN